jgi:hypothetical protein
MIDSTRKAFQFNYTKVQKLSIIIGNNRFESNWFSKTFFVDKLKKVKMISI